MHNLSALKAVIFDLDGTLLNCPYDFAAMRAKVLEVAASFGIAAEALAGLGILEAIDQGAQLLGETAGARFHSQASQRVLEIEMAGAAHSRPLAGVPETLVWLREKGLHVGIITRNSTQVVEILLGSVEFHYDTLLAREDVARVKPHREHLETMLARLGCAPGEAIIVGDHIWDMVCGKTAGLFCIGVRTGASSEAKLREAGADVVLDSAADLPGWLSANRGFFVSKSISEE
jgi:phosphoglycolate phosphatase